MENIKDNEINPYDYPKIPLHHILLSTKNYRLKKDKTTELNPVLKHIENDEIIIITKKPDGNYLYINAKDDTDRGLIYNYCKNRNILAKDLINNYQLWIKNEDNSKFLSIPSAKYSNNTSHNITKELEEFKKYPTNTDDELAYLTTHRAIAKNIISNFEGLKLDSNNNLIIPQYKIKYYNDKTTNIIPIGYTQKLLKPFTKYDAEIEQTITIKSLIKGKKGFEIIKSNNIDFNKIEDVYITESIIDTLSLIELHKDYFNLDLNKMLLIGTSGQFSFKDTELKNTMLEIIKRLPKNTMYSIGFDKDDAGQSFKNKFKEFFEEQNKLKNLNTFSPYITKDFNDELKLIKILNIETKDYMKLKDDGIKEAINRFYDVAPNLLRRQKATLILSKVDKLSKILPMTNKQREEINFAIERDTNRNTKKR